MTTAIAPATPATAPTIVIRHATDADVFLLVDLAALDSRPQLSGRALIAEVDGVPRAALDLGDGSVAADPFAPTTALVELLRLHARNTGAGAASRSRPSWRSSQRRTSPGRTASARFASAAARSHGRSARASSPAASRC